MMHSRVPVEENNRGDNDVSSAANCFGEVAQLKPVSEITPGTP